MELETVLYQKDGNVGIVTLNRTKAMNSMNKQLFADLTVAFEAARDDDEVRCVVMRGEGRAFCAGGDIAEMKGITTESAFFDFMSVAGGFTTLLNTFPKPVVASPRCHCRSRCFPVDGSRHCFGSRRCGVYRGLWTGGLDS